MMRRINLPGISGHTTDGYLPYVLIILVLSGASVSRAQIPRSAAAYYNRGNERFKKGDLDGAIDDFNAALTFDPRLATAYNMRGCARYNKHDLNGGIADF